MKTTTSAAIVVGSVGILFFTMLCCGIVGFTSTTSTVSSTDTNEPATQSFAELPTTNDVPAEPEQSEPEAESEEQIQPVEPVVSTSIADQKGTTDDDKFWPTIEPETEGEKETPTVDPAKFAAPRTWTDATGKF